MTGILPSPAGCVSPAAWTSAACGFETGSRTRRRSRSPVHGLQGCPARRCDAGHHRTIPQSARSRCCRSPRPGRWRGSAARPLRSRRGAPPLASSSRGSSLVTAPASPVYRIRIPPPRAGSVSLPIPDQSPARTVYGSHDDGPILPGAGAAPCRRPRRPGRSPGSRNNIPKSLKEAQRWCEQHGRDFVRSARPVMRMAEAERIEELPRRSRGSPALYCSPELKPPSRVVWTPEGDIEIAAPSTIIAPGANAAVALEVLTCKERAHAATAASRARNSRGLREPSDWCGRDSLYQWIQLAMATRASVKVAKLCCQTHSSFSLRKKRSMIPFCSARRGKVQCSCRCKSGLVELSVRPSSDRGGKEGD
jgi:hypothetical protein